jgi:anti-sigma regulatory factor (Ser/Thr protein kinase)
MKYDLPEISIPAPLPVYVAPLYRAAQYDGERGNAAAARRLADGFLSELAIVFDVQVRERLCYDALLVVTELVTNAEQHAPGPCVLELEGNARSVTVTVWDSSLAPPRVFPRDPQRVGGHGMEVVGRLCDEVTVELVPVGKRVRATLPFP